MNNAKWTADEIESLKQLAALNSEEYGCYGHIKRCTDWDRVARMLNALYSNERGGMACRNKCSIEARKVEREQRKETTNETR